MKTCEQVPREQTRLFDEILYGWYEKRKLARRYYSRAWQGEQTRHKWRIKRMKSCKRMTEYETRKMWNRCFLGRYEKTYLQQLRPSYLTF